MGYRRTPFAPEEWYHIYNRGIDKRIIFNDEYDFQRFKKLLYLANTEDEINLELLKHVPYKHVFSLPRAAPLVSIGAYCLMDNHPHLIIQEKKENGTVTFMHKLATAYTMYFNKKYDRIGNLMIKPFRSKHIADEGYLRRVVQYTHLNPAEIFEPKWKQGEVQNMKKLEEKLLAYQHSSLFDYFGIEKRPELAIIDRDAYLLLADNLPSFSSVLADALSYYEETANSFEPKPRGRPKKATPFN